MAALKASTLAVLLFCLFQPTLVLTSTVEQRNFVGVLIDDSRSMTLPGDGEEPRSQFVTERFGPEGSDLLERLEERFALRFFRFSSTTSRVDDPAGLTYDGTRTDLTTALNRVREELSSVPVSGLVVVSDGADNSGTPVTDALVPLQAASIPIYTVGLGAEALSPDIQVGRVEAPRAVLRGTSLLVDVVVSNQGFDGRTVPLVVEDVDRILTEEEVTLRGDGQPTVVRVRLSLDEPGARRIRFRIPPLEDEAVSQNNERSVLVEVREDREKILFFDGEPRWEVKFVRRAVTDDENLQVVLLQRTAENKYLRLAVDDSLELEGGFPKTREELFQYEGLILGSVEASFFTHDQLTMIADFASQRGGGLLALGGNQAFGEGGYAGTPVAEVLPVILGERSDPRANLVELRVRPTAAGASHVATQIRPASATEPAAWDSLPPLLSVNPITRVKPGATALLTGETENGEDRVVLAFQRFGRGKAAAFTVLDSWMWQMHADMPLDDLTHETFWQQLLRWLIDGVPGIVNARLDREQVEAGEPVSIFADVNDSTFLAVNNARVAASIVRPDGSSEEVPLEWTLEQDGEYRGTFTPTIEGDYEIAVNATRGDDHALGGDLAFLRVGTSDEEFFDANMRRPFLERLAQNTGGRFYTPATVDDLPEDLQYTGAGVTITEERDLWDMPFLFLLLVLLVGGEWAYRRTRGLV